MFQDLKRPRPKIEIHARLGRIHLAYPAHTHHLAVEQEVLCPLLLTPAGLPYGPHLLGLPYSPAEIELLRQRRLQLLGADDRQSQRSELFLRTPPQIGQIEGWGPDQ